MNSYSASNPNPATSAVAIRKGNAALVSQGLHIQAYALSVNQQSQVDFSKDPALKTYQDSINAGLRIAQSHANNYLQVLQPGIIKNMSNIGNYYALHNAVPSTLPPGSTKEQWIKELQVLQIQASNYQTASKKLLSQINLLVVQLNSDTASFAGTVTELNTAVNGDHGALKSLDAQLKATQSQINLDIAAIVASGLAVITGTIMIIVGAVAELPTAGASTGLIISGIGIVIGGVTTGTVSVVSLVNAIKSKAKILEEESELKAEVKLAQGISSAYTNLNTLAATAATAAQQMGNAWESLQGDLGSLISDLQNGIKSTDEIRTMWLNAANNEVKTVIQDINVIKQQMAGVNTTNVPKGESLADTVWRAAHTSNS